MSTKRISDKAGFVNPSRLPRGPNGLPLCRWCSKEIPVSTGRKTFCSDQCISDHKILTDPSHVRKLVHKRDAGVCSKCGLDTDALVTSITEAWMLSENREDIMAMKNSRESIVSLLVAHGWSLKAAESSLCHWTNTPRLPRGKVVTRSLWAADHIVPVVEGGGECGLDNYRTLCVPCHRKETAELRTRLAKARKQEEGGK